MPRDRKGHFHNHLLPAYSRRQDTLETTIIQLYSKGVTTREIADLIEKMYGSYYSPTTALMLDLRTDFSLPCKLIAEENFLYDSIFTRI